MYCYMILLGHATQAMYNSEMYIIFGTMAHITTVVPASDILTKLAKNNQVLTKII